MRAPAARLLFSFGALALALLCVPAEPALARDPLAGLSLEARAAQLLVPEVWVGRDADQRERFRDVERWVRELGVGGVHVFGSDRAAAKKWIAHLQRRARRRLLVTADLEGGLGYSLAGATRLPLGMALAATGDEQSAYDAGRITALEAKAVGIDVNFYPVADVNNDPENPIINVRSFGEDPAAVARFVRAYVTGSQRAGVLACAKHFPGHGDTSVDSHLALPVIDKPRAELLATELPPFAAAIDAGVACVMTGHLAVPAISEERDRPATLSRAITTTLLREEMGFAGLVVTDSLKMQGVTDRYPAGEACVRALRAGADVLLFPADVDACHRAVVDAVTSGALPRARVDDAARRVLAAKARAHAKRPQKVNERAHAKRARELAARSITLLGDPRGDLPLPKDGALVLALHDGATSAGKRLSAALGSKRVTVGPSTDVGTRMGALESARAARAVVLALYVRVAAFKGEIGLSKTQLELARKVLALDKPVVVVAFASPYSLSFVPADGRARLLAFDSHAGAERAVSSVLRGGAVSGRLPVTLPGVARRGAGVTRGGGAR